MITIIGALIGFLGSALPQIVKYLQARSQYKHELEMFKLQIEVVKVQGQLKLQELEAKADIEESKVLHKRTETTLTGWKIIDGLLSLYNSSVRPTLTYAFTAFYGYVKYSQYHLALAQNDGWELIVALWTDYDMALFACIVTFWFGQRAFKYTLDKISPVREVNGNNT